MWFYLAAVAVVLVFLARRLRAGGARGVLGAGGAVALPGPAAAVALPGVAAAGAGARAAGARAPADPYLPALDGIRALALVSIWAFHNWQQAWIDIDLHIGGWNYPLGNLQRKGFLALEVFFTLSGFCLFYPIARHLLEGARDFNAKDFYLKRARRILPPYFILMGAVLVFPMLSGSTFPPPPAGEMLQKVLVNATFTETVFQIGDGVFSSTAWTLCIEVQFYVVTPLIVWLYKKRPVATCLALIAVANASKFLLIFAEDGFAFWQRNFVVSYMDMFALGMLAAYALVWLRRRYDAGAYRPFMTAASLLCLPLIWQFHQWPWRPGFPPQLDCDYYWYVVYRTPYSLVLVLWIVSTCLAHERLSRKVYGNRAFVFLSGISYPFFLWHQNIHILFKRAQIPYTTADPVMADRPAMRLYIAYTLIASLCVAVTSTYLVERPVARLGFLGFLRGLAGAGVGAGAAARARAGAGAGGGGAGWAPGGVSCGAGGIDGVGGIGSGGEGGAPGGGAEGGAGGQRRAARRWRRRTANARRTVVWATRATRKRSSSGRGPQG
jgi:peptidoglycan/LPS O-acetylase OafA/YrhL